MEGKINALVDKVIEQLLLDVDSRDFTAIECMLEKLIEYGRDNPPDSSDNQVRTILRGYLPEADSPRRKDKW